MELTTPSERRAIPWVTLVCSPYPESPTEHAACHPVAGNLFFVDAAPYAVTLRTAGHLPPPPTHTHLPSLSAAAAAGESSGGHGEWRRGGGFCRRGRAVDRSKMSLRHSAWRGGRGGGAGGPDRVGVDRRRRWWRCLPQDCRRQTSWPRLLVAIRGADGVNRSGNDSCTGIEWSLPECLHTGAVLLQAPICC